MNRNGNSGQAQTGPVPSMKRVTAGILSSGAVSRIATASTAMVPILTAPGPKRGDRPMNTPTWLAGASAALAEPGAIASGS